MENDNINGNKLDFKNVMITSFSLLSSLILIYIIVFLISKAWKKGQINS